MARSVRLVFRPKNHTFLHLRHKSESWGNLPSCPGRSPGLSPVCRVSGPRPGCALAFWGFTLFFLGANPRTGLAQFFFSHLLWIVCFGVSSTVSSPLRGWGSDDFDGHKSRFGRSLGSCTPRRAPLLRACPNCFRRRHTGLRVRTSVRAFNDYTATVSFEVHEAGYSFILKYMFTASLKYKRAPEGNGDGCALLVVHDSPSYVRYFPFVSLYRHVLVEGAPGHNRWGVAETPLPAKSQGMTGDCTF